MGTSSEMTRRSRVEDRDGDGVQKTIFFDFPGGQGAKMTPGGVPEPPPQKRKEDVTTTGASLAYLQLPGPHPAALLASPHMDG